jgi:hypothetical protein
MSDDAVAATICLCVFLGGLAGMLAARIWGP